MRKIQFLLMFLLFCISTAWGQEALVKSSRLNSDGTFGYDMHWYKLQLGCVQPNGYYDMRFDPVTRELRSHQNNNLNEEAGDLFAFVGGPDSYTEGYVIYNYAAGPDYQVWSDAYEGGYSSATAIKMLAKQPYQRWIIERSGTNPNHIVLRRKEVDNVTTSNCAYLNRHRESNSNYDKIGYWVAWNAKNDAHSDIILTELTQDEVDRIVPIDKNELKRKAGDLLTKQGVGYPTTAERNKLQRALDDLNGNDTKDKAIALKNAVYAYKTTENVNMPEPGKAYQFAVEFPNGGRFYVGRGKDYYGKDIVTWVKQADQAITLICQKVTDKTYMFVTDDGLYHRPFAKFSDNQLQEQYDSEICDIKIEKFHRPIGISNSIDCEDERLFGYLQVVGKFLIWDQNIWQYVYRDQYLLVNNDINSPDVSYWNELSFSEPYSSAVVAIEVPSFRENVITPNKILGDKVEGLSKDHIATFSAPYATEIPKNVNAYIVNGLDSPDGENQRAELVEIWGHLPKNQGVILVSEQNDYRMIPSIDMSPDLKGDNQVKISDNMLGNTAQGPKQIPEGSYVLANGPQKNVTQFYKLKDYNKPLRKNRAYLPVPAGVANFSLSMEFHNLPTGIDAVVNDGQQKSDAPIYDLTGRRVFNPVKGGIYIQNGRKFILK